MRPQPDWMRGKRPPDLPPITMPDCPHLGAFQGLDDRPNPAADTPRAQILATLP
jgi:hypothetical protein